MTEAQIPTPNTNWVLMLYDKESTQTVNDWLEELGCRVKRDIDPVPMSSGKVAIGTFAPPNLDVLIADNEQINPLIASANPQLTSDMLW